MRNASIPGEIMDKIEILVKANSKNNTIHFDDNKKVYVVEVKEKAEKNKANIAMIKLASKFFKKKARIVSGLMNKRKIVQLE